MPRRAGLQTHPLRRYMHLNSVSGSTPEATERRERAAGARFFCFRRTPKEPMTDLIAKTAIDRRLADIVQP